MYLNIKVNNRPFIVNKHFSVLEACKFLGVLIPRFCYHENLSVAGNCRMCLVETDKSPKPVAACAAPLVPQMSIFTHSPFVLKARENILESLLLNHPLDCPICDQAGECDLQNQSKQYGSTASRFFFNKRSVEDKGGSTLIKMIMTRCIHCTRCVRFSSEISGGMSFGTLGRGTTTEIGTYVDHFVASEISANVIDLCPVGALTAKPYAFKVRPWELQSLESIDLTDSVGSDVYIQYKNGVVTRVLPKKNADLNDTWISDKARFSFDFLKYNRVYSFFEGNTLQTYLLFRNFSREGAFSLTESLDKSLKIKESLSFLAFKAANFFFLQDGILASGAFLRVNGSTLEPFIGGPSPLLSKASYLLRSGTHLLKQRLKLHFMNNFAKLLQLLQGQNSYGKSKLFLINSNIDLDSLALLKSLEIESGGSVKVRSLPSFSKRALLHSWGSANSILQLNLSEKSKFCLVCSSLLKIENTLLNLKLKLRHSARSFEVFSLGLFSSSNYKITTLSLKLGFLPLIASSKVPLVSKKLLFYQDSLIVLGESMYDRIVHGASIFNLIKSRVPTLLLYMTSKFNNKEGTDFSFIRPVTRRLLLRSNKLFIFNLDDTASLRRLLFLTGVTSQNIFWLSSHRAFSENNIKQVFPLRSELEEGGIYFNFEQKIKVAQGVSSIYDVPSLKSVVATILLSYGRARDLNGPAASGLLNISKLSSQTFLKPAIFNAPMYSFIREILANPPLANALPRFPLRASSFYSPFFKDLFVLRTYPDKSLFEDFYRSSLSLKNSLVMLRCSRDLRNNFKTFSLLN